MQAIKKETRFIQLTKALELGWEIEEPILLGSTWNKVAEGSGTYHFVLRNKGEDKTTLLSLPPSPQLMVFLADNNFHIRAMSG